MKKLLFIIITFLFAINLHAQDPDTSVINQMQKATMILPRYKMYKTENNFILLKFDTRTGKAWMTQFRSGETKSLEIPIEYFSLSYEWKSWNGRYDMYETNNIYKFIIVDTYTGKTYLLQWNVDEDKRFIEPIVNEY